MLFSTKCCVSSLVLIALVAACAPSENGHRHRCHADADCENDQVCDKGECDHRDSAAGGASAGCPDGEECGPFGAGAGPGSHPGSSGPDAPRFLSFGTNVTALTPDGTVTFTAVITDPQGIADVIGGTLSNEAGATFGSLSTTSEEGAYSLSLSWDAINDVEPIQIDQGTKARRGFVAKFFDAEGNWATQTIEVALACAHSWGACGGRCLDMSIDHKNCGACGNDCGYRAPWGAIACREGSCAVFGACSTLSEGKTCDAFCAAEGRQCVDACGFSGGQSAGILVYDEQPCQHAVDAGSCNSVLLADSLASCCCI